MKNLNDYLSTVGSKLNDYQSKLIVKGARDASGFNYTADRILKSSENLFFSMDGRDVCDPVDAMFAGFSTRPGFADVSNVASVSVTDISILSTINSIMSYVAVERAMNDPIQTIYYQNLAAVNTAGGFTAGDTVVSPFAPISNSIDLGAAAATGSFTPEGSVTDSTDVTTKANLVPGSVIVTAKLSDAVVAIGKDLTKDGTIYFDRGNVIESASVDYNTGKVTLKKVAANTVADSITVAASVDMAGSDGSDTLKVKSKLQHTQVQAKPKQIILDSSIEDIAYMNKQSHGLAAAGVSMDYGKRGILELIEAYTAYIDVTLAQGLHKAAVQNTPVTTFDLTAYSLAGSEASTKNDMVNGFVIQLNKQLQKQSRRGATCYVVDTEGAAILGNNPMYFTPNALFDQNLNGMIGTYRGIPVVRHWYFDGKFDQGGNKYAFVGAMYKSADGAAGPIAFSEFLPPYSVRPAFNYDQPGQMAQSLFAQNTTDVIVPGLMTYGLIKIA